MRNVELSRMLDDLLDIEAALMQWNANLAARSQERLRKMARRLEEMDRFHIVTQTSFGANIDAAVGSAAIDLNTAATALRMGASMTTSAQKAIRKAHDRLATAVEKDAR